MNIEHHLVLIVEITCPQANKQTNKQTTTRHTEKISRSDLTVRLKINNSSSVRKELSRHFQKLQSMMEEMNVRILLVSKQQKFWLLNLAQ